MAHEKNLTTFKVELVLKAENEGKVFLTLQRFCNKAGLEVHDVSVVPIEEEK